MKAKRLLYEITKILNETDDNCEVYFDTEAKTFDCHLIEIESVSSDDNIITGETHIILRCN